MLGSVAAVVNSQCGCGKYHVSAYEAVFGQIYDHPFSCSKEEARRCWTVKDRMKVTNDPDFDVYVNENYIIEDVDVGEEDDIDDIDESGYFSEEELSEEENEEVTDAHFDLHLYDDTELKSPPEEIVETNIDLFDEALMEGLGDINEIGSEAISSPITFSPVETKECLTGICFGPNCVERCFTHNISCTAEEKKCNHQWTTIDINTGEYVAFPSSFSHRGYFQADSTKVVVTAQLFASSNGSSPNQPGRYLSSSNSMNDTVRGVLIYDITSLSNDVLTDWDSSYPIATFPPCKFFGGVRINQESNRQIHRSQFHLLPHIVTLVNYFEGIDKTLSVDQVWLIRKSDSEEGCQRWHQDVPKLEGERSIVKTIVVNLGHT